ncbi:MAG: BON domain-containing protein [Nitrospirae bacterium]|nr:MAG: BON domain-containing protein [Nitrospirota bacterium]
MGLVILLFALLAPLLLAGCFNPFLTAGNTAADVGTMGAEERRLYNIAEDYTIKSEITNKYFDETMLMEINTDVYEGRVMLTGAVTKAATKQKAELIARRVKGVREIFNEIQVTTNGGVNASTKDFSIEIKLKFNLLAAKGISSLNFRWRSVHGVVYFIGGAQSREELNKVIVLAREMDGVRKVVSHIRIRPKKGS